MAPIKVMIVDDEILVRQGLELTIDWDKYGMTVVASESNGERAWEAYQRHAPDVVITDIVMPGKDGIDLAKLVKQSNPNVKLLVLSCHRDFEYAQKFMQMGASGYILKTSFDDRELEQYLLTFRNELAGKHPSGEAGTSKTTWKRWLELYDPNFPEELVRRVLALADTEQFYAGLLCSSTPDAADQFPLILSEETGEQLVLEQVNDSIWLIIGGEKAWSITRRLMSRPNIDISVWHIDRKGPFATPKEAMRALKQLWRVAKIKQEFGLDNSYQSDLITKALLYVDDHLGEPLRSRDVAKELGLSRSHFSTLFSKGTGQSFISFLSGRRLSAAKLHLSSTDWKTADIAEQIGMPDVNYFSKWFKKHTGRTPTEYRSEQKEG